MKLFIHNVAGSRLFSRYNLFLFFLLQFSGLAAQKRAGELKGELEYAETDSARARLSALLAWELRETKPAEAMQLTARAIEFGTLQTDTALLAEAYRTKAFVLVAANQLSDGIRLYDTALFCAKRCRSAYYEMVCCRQMADMYKSFADYNRAIEWYEKALELAQRSGHVRMAAELYSIIGGLCQKMEVRMELVQKYFQKALEISQELEDWANAAIHSADLALVYKNAGDTALALAELERAADLMNRDKTDALRYASNRSVLASAYLDLDWLEESERYALSSLLIMDKQQRSLNVLQPLLVLSRLYVKKGSWMIAERYAQRLHEEANARKDFVYIRDACKLLSEIGRLKNDARAVAEFDAYAQQWTDSVVADEKKQIRTDLERKATFGMAELRSRYETQIRKLEENEKHNSRRYFRNLVITAGLSVLLLLSLGVLLFVTRKRLKAVATDVNAHQQEKDKRP